MATLTISDDLYEQLRAAATYAQRPVDEFLREMIETVAHSNPAPMTEPSTRDEEMERLRQIFGHKLTEFDAQSFLMNLGIEPMSSAELDRAIQDLPELEMSLSGAIVQMRNEERY